MDWLWEIRSEAESFHQTGNGKGRVFGIKGRALQPGLSAVLFEGQTLKIGFNSNTKSSSPARPDAEVNRH